MNNDNNNDNIYEYFIRIAKTSKENNSFKVIIPNHISTFERKFDCILNKEHFKLDDDDVPDIANINILSYQKRFKEGLDEFMKKLHKLQELRRPLFKLLKYIEEIYEELFNKLYNRIILLGLQDDYIRGYFFSIIVIEKTLINIKNIFIT